MHLIAYTGLRRGEALGLKWEYVDLDNQTLRIVGSLVSTSQGVRLEPPKTVSGERIVDLDDDTVAVLRQHQEKQVATARQFGVPAPDILFTRKFSRDWSHPNTLVRSLERLRNKAGCSGVTFRSLRHFHASVALQTGQNIVVISKRLGHSNVSITSDIYAHSLPGWQREAAQAFAEELKRNRES